LNNLERVETLKKQTKPGAVGARHADAQVADKFAEPAEIAETDLGPLTPPEFPAGFKKHLTVDLGGGVTMEFVLIPAGEFLMGSPHDEERRYHEGKQHRVRITNGYYLGVYEVTQEQYERLVGDNPSWFSEKGGGKEKVAGLDTSRFPVERVSWEDAIEFCRKLSELPSEREAGRRCRLPTEAEWEYACRAGTTTPTGYGPTLSSRTDANFRGTDANDPYGAREVGPYLARTVAVGSYRANSWGLYDMHGNVYEWCQDWYSDDYYENSPANDPTGPAAGYTRVVRGGTWSGWAYTCRSASREGLLGIPTILSEHVGLRVVLDLPDASTG